ncbi:TrbC/VirB2 family protein [Patescibacteria group bacterium]|nr:TrbC/VirB2 family protein [Patescibacteria group bacterium]
MKSIFRCQSFLKISLLAIFIAMNLVFIAPAGAVDIGSQLQKAGTGLYEKEQPAPLATQIGNIINILLGLLGVILVIIIVYAGYLWMTAGGDTEQVKKAKSWMINAVIGMIIILSSYAIADFVISKLAEGIGAE